jgi:hypothetical protein
MALRLFRAFASALADSADPTQIQPSHWNADISHSMATGKNLGRFNGGTGAIEELDAPMLTGRMLANRGGTNQTGATAGAYNKVQLNNEVTDVNSWFDSVTNFRYTPTTAGTFLVFGSVSINSGATGESPAVSIRKNGGDVLEGPFISTVGNTVVVVVAAVGLIDLNGTTDYIELWGYLPSGVTVINGTASRTYLSVIKLSN